MRTCPRLVLGSLLLATLATTAFAGPYAVDPAHTSLSFRIGHLGISTVVGRFNDVSGDLSFDKDDPSLATFQLTIKADSVDTGNTKRDDHLRSPDFFNVKQFPTITFKSRSVKKAADGYEVVGDLTLHGVAKPVTLLLKGGNTAEFPPKTQRIGFTTELTVKRSDFEMKGLLPAVGDEVALFVSFEGIAK